MNFGRPSSDSTKQYKLLLHNMELRIEIVNRMIGVITIIALVRETSDESRRMWVKSRVVICVLLATTGL